MSKLVIVESPAKAKTIQKYLGKDFEVMASMGHLRDLPAKKLGIDLENDFKPIYQPLDGKKEKVIKELCQAAKESDFVYLATDPDREGEAISWHLKEMLGLDDSDLRRVTFNEITKSAVQNGIAQPRAIDQDLVDAQQARRILDRIVGYQLSPFLWRKIRRGLSAGRVQSVVTRLVVDREREIRAFQPEEYWSLEAMLAAGRSSFTAAFYGNAEGKMELKDEQSANAVVEAVKDAPFTVKSVKKGKKKKSPAPPFITSTLQQEASRKLNMVAKRTMAVAQELYEGVEIEGHGLTGLITYMRTDSLRLSEEAVAAAQEYIQRTYGEKYYPAKPRQFKTKSSAQDAHEAIRPTNVLLTPDEVKSSLTGDQFKLYKLIWSRFVACQMADAQLDTVSADVESAGYLFRATGFKIRFSGFTAVYEEASDEGSVEGGKLLPDIHEGDVLHLKKLMPAQHFTQPPARYTEASLIRAMEEKGIGRPSTYAPTITTILDREYVVKEKKALRPTPLGEVVTDLMIAKFHDIADPKFTAKMETQLDEIESGKIPYVTVLHKFYDGFHAELEQAEKDLDKQRIKVQDEESDVECELCGRKMVIKHGRFGKFLACPGYPECKNTKAITKDTGVACPVCGAKVVEKKSKRGFTYLGCEKNPTCPFMTWDKPTKEVCPQCGSAIFQHFDRETRKYSHVCHKPDCGYSKEIPKPTRKSKAKAEEEQDA